MLYLSTGLTKPKIDDILMTQLRYKAVICIQIIKCKHSATQPLQNSTLHYKNLHDAEKHLSYNGIQG